MREKRADYWRRLCPVKALTEQIPPSAAEGSDYIFPGTQNGAVQDSAMQTAHQLHGDPLQGTRERRAAPRGGGRTAPARQPPGLANFQVIFAFCKTCLFEEFEMASIISTNKSFQKHSENGI